MEKRAPGMHPEVWCDEYAIHSYDADAVGRASLPALCRFFQESAWHHATSMKLGYSHLAEQGLFWVLSRLTIEIVRYPLWGESVMVRTWASGLERLFALREFTIEDAKGNRIGGAGSAWLVLNESTRKPFKPASLFEEVSIIPNRRALENGPEKVSPLEASQKIHTRTVQYSDLDVQKHANNVRYIEWILDGFPPDTHLNGHVSRFSINFLAECSHGDLVTLHFAKTGENSPTGERAGAEPHHLASITRESDGREICRAHVVWRNDE